VTWQAVVLLGIAALVALGLIWALVVFVLMRWFWASIRALDDDTNAMQRHVRPTDRKE
jgi:hypothetical protein